MQRKSYYRMIEDMRNKMWLFRVTARDAEETGQLTSTERAAFDELDAAVNAVDRIMIAEGNRRAGRG